MDDHTRLLADIIQQIGAYEARERNMTPEQLEAREKAAIAERAARIARHDAKWRSLLARMSKECFEKVDAIKRRGGSINKLYTHRRSGNVAAMMVIPNVWDSAKGKMGRKIAMVYPDGSQTETFEKTISIKQTF